jgi:predicted Zn-dependent protease
MSALARLSFPLLLAALVAGCATVPYTHRSQLILVSEGTVDKLGVQAFQEVLKKEKIDHNPQLQEIVTGVGERIARAADRPQYHWQFVIIDDAKNANAFALPGGKVAVYSGLFPVAENTAGLAAVWGHEVGHVVARHAAERMSQGYVLGAVGAALQVGLGATTPAASDAIMQAFGLGAQVGLVLPFSREQEAEADHLGLILMAKAGYDPHAALDLWRRFEGSGKKSPPELLSTHPGYGTRERNIESWLPEAMTYYHPDGVEVVPLPGARPQP